MKKKGFTLIELLAVIIVIAVVAVIAIPITLNVIDDVRKEANFQTAVAVLNGAKNYYAESWLDDSKKTNLDGKTNVFDDLVIENKPETGEVYITEDGKISISVTIGDTSYVKQFGTTTFEEKPSDEDIFVGVDENAPKVEFSINGISGTNGWYKESYPVVTINVTDGESGVLNYRWCTGNDCEPNEVATKLEKQVNILDSESTQVCVIAKDKSGNSSSKTCSELLKVDTQGPSITGIADVVITKDSEIDLRNGVSVSDILSGLEGTFDVDPSSIDTKTTGSTEVIYTAVDKAGNKTTQTINVIVSADAPTITFEVASGIINDQGWAKDNFFVTINVKDNTGHGLKEFSICTGVSDRCEPTEGSTIEVSEGALVGTATREILNESDNNRICVQAKDNTGQSSAVICSTPYKLDKTAPVAGTINIVQDKGENDWYTEDITINPVNGSDGLSGHLSTVVDINNIKENTSGTKVTVTTLDKALNESTREYTIKVDKTRPSCNITSIDYLATSSSKTMELTCTNTFSGLQDIMLSKEDISTSNNNVQVTSVTRSEVTNGYKYTITVKGLNAGNSNILIPADKIKTVAGLGNELVTSEVIKVTGLSIVAEETTVYVGGADITATITGENYGTLSCSSSDDLKATCTIFGTTLTVKGISAGSVTITVRENNGNVSASYTVTVIKPTLSLAETSGTLYEGGTTLTATIDGKDYGSLTCGSDNEAAAKCSINGTTLTTIPVKEGTATIVVTEGNGNVKATYSAVVYKPSLSLTPSSGTIYVAGSSASVIIDGDHYGELSCSSSDDTKATCTISGTTLTIAPIAQGTATITVKESNGNVSTTYDATVYKPTLSLASSSGTIYVGGNSTSTTISGNHYGTLTCSSSDDNIAKCSIDGTTLTVSPVSAGSATITVSESNGNVSTTYDTTVYKPTLSLEQTNGTTYIGGSNLSTTIKGDNYGTLSCSSSDENIAKCTISGTTLTMTPQSIGGSAVITVTESYGNVTAKYTFTNIDSSYNIDVEYKAVSGAINSNGWAKEDFYVTVTLTDTPQTGLKEFKLCTSSVSDTCVPDNGSTYTTNTATREITTESDNNRICIQATDNYGRKSGIICSDAYKLDKTDPTAGTIKVNGSSTIAEWYTENVTITPVDGSDSLSQHDSTTVSPTSITSNTNGTKVTVTTTDKAGNEATRDYTIKVDKNTPTVSIEKSVSNNQNVLTGTISPSTTTSGYTYQWYKESTAISGATSTSYTTTESGTYKLVVTTGSGKTINSNEITINSYTVSYNLNGGTGSITSTTKIQDLSTNITSTVPTRTGYTFIGWGLTSADKTKTYSNGDPYTANASDELYAIWKKTLTAKFNANGASLSSTSDLTCDIYNAEESCSVTAPTISRSGFTIVGYNTSASSTTNNSAYNTSTGKLTLTASNTGSTWYAVTYKDVTVTFNRNGAASITKAGGSASTATSITDTCRIQNSATTCSITAASITASSNTPTVVGWNTTSGSTSSAWSANEAKSFSSNASYYAITTKNAVTLTAAYNANGASLSTQTTANTQCTIAATYNGTAQGTSCTVTAPTITRSGYTIVGYNTSASSTSNNSAYSSSTGKITLTTSNTGSTWYAVTYKRLTATFNANGATLTGTTSPTCDMYNTNTSCTVTAPTITRSGYTIVGFGTSSGATTSAVDSGKTASISANTTYYAVTSKKVTVTFNANGATLTGTTNPSCVLYNTNANCSVTAPTITRSGYIIVGFNTSSSATTATVNSGASLNISSDVAYYAITKQVTLTLSSTSGTATPGGTLTVTISGNNYGTLSCTSSNQTIATCSISGTTLVITAINEGIAELTVKESTVNKTVKYTISISPKIISMPVSAGSYHSAAIDSNGNIWAWGLSNVTGTSDKQTKPKQITSGTKFVSVTSSSSIIMAIDSSGNLWGWGTNNNGLLLNGTTTGSISSPIKIMEGTTFTHVSIGSYHVLAIDSSGNLWGWGANVSGQFGNGTTTTSITTTPIKIMEGTKFKYASAGNGSSMVIDVSGNLWAFGENSNYELGTGTSGDILTPVQIKSGTKFISVSLQRYHGMAIDESGNLWGWGSNSYGAVGNGSTTRVKTPIQIKSGTQFTSVSTGYYYTMALDSNGNLWTWGYNDYGQIGNNTTTDQTTPVQIKSGTKFTSISTHTSHAIAVDSSGNIWAWGSNDSGQIGNNTTTDQKIPRNIILE